MELVVPASQVMDTKADLDAAVGPSVARMDGIATNVHVLRMLLTTRVPIALGILGLHFTG